MVLVSATALACQVFPTRPPMTGITVFPTTAALMVCVAKIHIARVSLRVPLHFAPVIRAFSLFLTMEETAVQLIHASILLAGSIQIVFPRALVHTSARVGRGSSLHIRTERTVSISVIVTSTVQQMSFVIQDMTLSQSLKVVNRFLLLISALASWDTSAIKL
jgi:hypothetical protein